MHVVTLTQYVGKNGDAQIDFPGLIVWQYEEDQIHYIEVLVPNLDTWIVAFFKSDFMSTDYGMVDVEVYSREGPTSERGIQSPKAGSTPTREGLTGALAGPLEPESDLPPTSISYYPNRINPVQPWTPTA